MRHSRLYGIMAGMLSGMLVLSVSSCVKDDFDRYQNASDALSFKVEVSGGWSDGASSSSTSIRRMSQSTDAEPLYLVTKVFDSAPVSAESEVVTRGTPIENASTLETGGFGLSAICYTGGWPEEGSTNNWTTNFAHNLNVTKQGEHWKALEKLEWPGSGSIRFFAYYPYSEKSNGCIAHSGTDATGAPVLTYTVPDDVKNQPDLLWAVTNHSGKSDAGGTVNLEFQHALTAVTIKTGSDMLSGTITGVKISGVYGKGSCRIGGTTWTTPDETRDFEIKDLKVILSPTTEDKNGLMINTGSGQDVTSQELTFMMVPQTLPEGAKLTINFTDDLTTMARTLTADIGGMSWPSGKKVAYSINSTGIVVETKVEFSKKPDGDIMPYSGVWYDATYKATVDVTQVGVETKTIDIPADKVEFQYKLENETDWKDCTTDTDAVGLLTIEAQSAYTTMSSGFDTIENGSEEAPFNLGTEKGETANCYLVDKAGYYSLPLVYGNGDLTLPAENPDGFKYFPNHKDEEIISPYISGAENAVLCWQDAPDLIDPASVKVEGDKLVFRIRKQTLTQGNALLAVRNSSKQILWSWHIWVTPYKEDFYNQGNFYHSTTTLKPAGYDFAQYNLGWCDPHEHEPSRKFSLRAVVDMSAYGSTTVEIGTFTQDIFNGSDAGDNTYYQWGRKDPMLGGIYNVHTPKYQYYKKYGYSGQTTDKFEFTMENKQVFNQYNQDGYNYSFCKNPGDKIDSSDPASNGVTIGYSIQHPYMFVTNSRCNDSSGENPTFNYRNHWHVPYTDKQVDYLNDETHIMFNAWDAGATAAPIDINDELTARDIKKSVYDPCPPKFKVPPLDAFRGIVNNKTHGSGNGNVWKLVNSGQTIEFSMTGVRNYALRNNEWPTVKPIESTSAPDPNFCEEFYKTSMPAFRMLTFVSSATIVKKEVRPGEADSYTAYQVAILRIDHSNRAVINYNTIELIKSSNSYGLPVRPIYSK